MCVFPFYSFLFFLVVSLLLLFLFLFLICFILLLFCDHYRTGERSGITVCQECGGEKKKKEFSVNIS